MQSREAPTSICSILHSQMSISHATCSVLLLQYVLFIPVFCMLFAVFVLVDCKPAFPMLFAVTRCYSNLVRSIAHYYFGTSKISTTSKGLKNQDTAAQEEGTRGTKQNMQTHPKLASQFPLPSLRRHIRKWHRRSHALLPQPGCRNFQKKQQKTREKLQIDSKCHQ